MDHAALIAQYGYAATFVGTLLEGETLLILSGLAAHRGYLSLPLVVLVGAVGGTIGDIGFFLLGRHYGPRLVERFPRFAPAVERVHRLVARFPALTVIAVRFMYGLRTAGPAIIGTTRMPWLQFLALNIVGAVLWSACWATAGWVLGHAAERLLGDLAHFEKAFLLVVAVLVIVGTLAWRAWQRRRQRRAPTLPVKR